MSQASYMKILNEEMKQVDIPDQTSTAYMHFQLNIQDFGAGIPKDKINGLFVNFGNLDEH